MALNQLTFRFHAHFVFLAFDICTRNANYIGVKLVFKLGQFYY